MRGDRYAKWLFGMAAVMNFSVGAALINPDLIIGGLFGEAHLPSEEIGRMWLTLCLWLVAMFGLVYVLVARDPVAMRGVIAPAAIAKLGVFIIATNYWLAGTIGTLLYGLAISDAVFAILFFHYLSKSRAGRPA
jgi:hypothetical protein